MANRKRRRPRNMRLAIYILPNFFTTCGLFCGFYSILASFNGDFHRAAWAIMFSMVFDWLDGKVARASHATSQFGIEYDSLSDVIAFGMAPAIMVYTWALVPFGRIGWLAAFLYAACAALRLARFNVQSATIETKAFQGMPTPAAGGLLATTVIFLEYLGWHEINRHIPILVLILSLAFLMVSKVRYQSLKALELSQKIPFQVLVVVLCSLVLIAAEPQITLFAIFFLYGVSGPVITLRAGLKKLSTKNAPAKEEELKV